MIQSSRESALYLSPAATVRVPTAGLNMSPLCWLITRIAGEWGWGLCFFICAVCTHRQHLKGTRSLHLLPFVLSGIILASQDEDLTLEIKKAAFLAQ